MKNIKTKNFVINFLESLLVVGYLLFEELIWNVFAKPIFQYIKNLVVLDSLKKTFLEMNRHLLLTIFIVIFAITEVMGFLSGFCLINGYFFTGVGVYACKIPIAVFTFWLFELTKEKLMTFHWLKIAYEYLMGVIDKLINSPIYVEIKAKISVIRSKIKTLVLHYFGEEGFIASVKSHYIAFKPHLIHLFKLQK